MRYIFTLLLLLCLASCANQSMFTEGNVELTGIASILPDNSEKVNRSGIIVGGEKILFRGEYKKFPEQTLGKRVKVSGILKKKNLPMFIWDFDKETEGVPCGIPVPPGTDIEKESIYYIIENPNWEICN